MALTHVSDVRPSTTWFCFREWTKNAASLDPLLKPPRSTVSPSMSLLLQGCHGLTPAPKGDLNLTDECAQGNSTYHLLGLVMNDSWPTGFLNLAPCMTHLQAITGKPEAYRAPCCRGEPGKGWPWGQSLAVGQTRTASTRTCWLRGCPRTGTGCARWRDRRALRSSRIRTASASPRRGWRASGTWNRIMPSPWRCSTASPSLSWTASPSLSSTTSPTRSLLGETRRPEISSFVSSLYSQKKEGLERLDTLCWNGVTDTVTHYLHIHTVLNLLCQSSSSSSRLGAGRWAWGCILFIFVRTHIGMKANA